MLKLEKIFECSCIDDFTGDFCEVKIEQGHLLFVSSYNPIWNTNDYINRSPVFNADGILTEENAVIDEQAGAHGSCSTILNGEAIILGGFNSNFFRQVP